MGRKVQIVLVGLAIAVAWPAMAADSPSEMLENGMYTEQTVGDLDAAIVIYQKVLGHADAAEAQKAQAQFRLGMCAMKKRSTAEAQKAFQAVVQNYPNQKDLVSQAQTRLMRLSAPNPAALMPPDTLVYFEVGSPGEQVAKIVTMLKGTPLANPLEVIDRQRAGQVPASMAAQQPKTPADMIAALLNPKMLEEFKKIRGMAAGLMDISSPSGPPPSIVVLYPGESDALRGLIMAGLLMVGQQGEVLEDMQTVVIPGASAMAAYDDNVVIAVTAEEGPKAQQRLAWCIRQYKGVSKEPSLATQNEAFARMTTPQARQKDALTVWANPAGVFERLQKQFGDEHARRLPRELALARDLGDIQNIDGAVARLVIDEKAPYLEACVSFKKDHQCLPYDLVRTPPLSPAGFQAVPADAVALVSLALSGAADAQPAQAAQQAVRHLTGLDIGREVFANIEQVNLFVVPHEVQESDAFLSRKMNPVVPFVGLSLTSHDPEMTRQLLDRLLRLPRMIQRTGEAGQSGEGNVPGRYLISSHSQVEIVRDPNGQQISRRVLLEPIYCYMGQAGRSTVLSLSPAIVEAARNAQRPGAVPAVGIRARLGQVPPGVCKLALVDAGGAVRLGAVLEKVGRSPASLTRPATVARLEAMSKLADALSKTSLELYTVEEPTALTVHAGLRDLPPLGELFPLIMQVIH